MNPPPFRDQVEDFENRFARGAKLWSFAHHGCLFGSIIASMVAGLLLQVDSKAENPRTVVAATILTSVAAVLTSISVSGGFERKWRSNRLSRGLIQGILLDIDSGHANENQLRDRLKDIIFKHDNEIVSESPGHPASPS